MIADFYRPAHGYTVSLLWGNGAAYGMMQIMAASLLLLQSSNSVTIIQMAEEKSKKKKRVRWSLYMLKCGDGTLYTGITNDLGRRTAQHNSGTASHYTRSRLPVIVIHQEPCKDYSSALKKEYAIKQLSRTAKEEYIRAVKTPKNKIKRADKPKCASFR